LVSLDKAVIARLDRGKCHFEILVDPKLAQRALEGEINILELLATDSIFKDSKKGGLASEKDLKEVFHTTDIALIAKQIIKEGKIQLTTEQRKERETQLRKRLVDHIVRNSMDPRTKTPHPPARIEAALTDAKFHPSLFRPFEQQVKEALDAIRPLIPISMEEIKLAVKIPPTWVGKAYGKIREFGKLLKEEWQSDGSLICLINLPAGQQNDFFDQVNAITKGEVELKIIGD
jgi:ribosome maturation protein SDO1